MNPGLAGGSMWTCASPRSAVGRLATSWSDMSASVRSRTIRSRGLHPNLLHGFDLGLDLHAVSDQCAASLQYLVIRQPEILPIDRGLCAERRTRIAPRVVRLSVLFDAQDHLAGGAFDRQITNHVDLVPGARLNTLADEAQFGVLRDIEEVRRLQMRVAIGDAGVDARRVDRHVHGRLREVAV